MDSILDQEYNIRGGLNLVPQTPIREEKGSGNIVYNELCQTQECGATNQIASFVISVTSHDFAHITLSCTKLVTFHEPQLIWYRVGVEG